MLAVTTGEVTALASVPFVGVGSASHCCGEQDSLERSSCLCYLGRRGFGQLLWWRSRQVRTLYWNLIAWSQWALPATVVADMTGEGADLAYVRTVGLGSARHRFSGQDI